MIAERELTVSEARSRLEKLCTHVCALPTIHFSNSAKLTATCTLHSDDGVELASGAGKGNYCELGSLAESLEHYFLTDDATQPKQCITAHQLTASAHYHDDWLIRSVPEHTSLQAFELTSIDCNERLFVPAVMLNPSDQYINDIRTTEASFLLKYASNSGMALGCTENEALLHAINECIERHALSVFYLSTCGLMRKPHMHVPAAQLIEQSVGTDIATLVHAKKINIQITKDFYGLFFCIAVGPKTEGSLSIVGSGCSTIANVAIYRAVTEQIQCYQLRGRQEVEEDNETHDMLANFNGLYNLIHPACESSPHALMPADTNKGLRMQIQQTVENLKRHGRKIFLRTLFNEPGLACVVQAYIPGLERFHLIRNGIPVASQSALSKGARGKDVYL